MTSTDTDLSTCQHCGEHVEWSPADAGFVHSATGLATCPVADEPAEADAGLLAAAFEIAAQAREIDCTDVAAFRVATLTPGRFDDIVSSAILTAELDPSDSMTVRAVLALVDAALASPGITAADWADECDHDGTETIRREAHGYLGDAPAGTVELLCAACGAVLPTVVASEIRKGQRFHTDHGVRIVQVTSYEGDTLTIYSTDGGFRSVTPTVL